MSSLFGVELPTPVNFVIAFVVVLALIGAVAWLVRRFGATRLDASARSRQPRLAVIDAASVDGRRKLVIVRRDNVEHLLMIGGPTDVVVETNIVRGAATSTRDAPPARNGGADALPRAIPLPDPTAWPLQPEPVPPPVAPVRAERAPRAVVDDGSHWQPQADEPPRAPRPAETMAGHDADYARPAPEHAPGPRIVHPEPAPPVAAAPRPAPPTDHSLAEMAQRLEAALRRPAAAGQGAKSSTDGTSPRVAVAGDAKAAPRAEPRPAPPSRDGTQPKSQASLEQEMASLLGRPGKT